MTIAVDLGRKATNKQTNTRRPVCLVFQCINVRKVLLWDMLKTSGVRLKMLKTLGVQP